jgi:hypothetical protein
MTLLEHFRRSPNWLVMLVAFAAVAVTTTALLPHADPEERSCLVCKASNQPMSELARLVDLAPPLASVWRAPVFTSRPNATPDIESGPARAPPV